MMSPDGKRDVHLLVDWRSTAHALRPKRPRTANWTGDPKVAREILIRLKAALSRIELPGKRYYFNTLLFGGFVGPDGAWTKQKQVLDEAIPRVSWSGILTPNIHLRELNVVVSLKPGDETNRLIGLFRPDHPIQEAHLNGIEHTDCSWHASTKHWLNSAFGVGRICPSCTYNGKAVSTILVRHQEKMVDTLLISYAFDQARSILDDIENQSEIWICSNDADFVPALAFLRRWGLSVTWLQTPGNTKFGYADLLRSFGVLVLDLPQLIRKELDHE